MTAVNETTPPHTASAELGNCDRRHTRLRQPPSVPSELTTDQRSLRGEASSSAAGAAPAS